MEGIAMMEKAIQDKEGITDEVVIILSFIRLYMISYYVYIITYYLL